MLRGIITLLTLCSLFISGIAFAEAPDAAKLYTKKCKVCHGADGKASKTGLKKGSPEDLFASIKGWTEEQVIKNVTEGKNKMPAYGPREGKKAKLNPEEIKAVSQYIMSMTK